MVSLILVLSIVATMTAFLPKASAHTPPITYPTVAGIVARPNPVGVGQQVGILMFIDKAPPLAQGDFGQRFHDYTVTVTKPDNTTLTLGPYNSDAISFGYAYYTPDLVGNYTLVFHFPETLIAAENPPPADYDFTLNNNAVYQGDQENDTYAASDSQPFTLVVQQEPVSVWSSAPLPTDYWTSPISALNREWYAVGGDWLGGAQIEGSMMQSQSCGPVPFTTAPNTAHILWTEPFWTGGIAGGEAGSHAYLTSAGRDNNSPIIIDGIIFLNNYGSNNVAYGWSAVSLYTGQTLYKIDSAAGIPYPSFASEYKHDSLSQQVVKPYLWCISGSTWKAVDPYSGQLVFTITNVPSGGTADYGEDGSILRYSIVNYGTAANPNKHLLTWNVSQVLSPLEAFSPNRPGGYKGTFDGTKGYSSLYGNVSIPDVQGSIFQVVQGKYIIGGTQGEQNQTAVKSLGNIWTIAIDPDHYGALISNMTFTPPKQAMDSTQYYYYGTGSDSYYGMNGPYIYADYNVFFYYESATTTWWGFDLMTGQQLWKSEPQGSLMSFTGGTNAHATYGILYTSCNINEPGGEIHAYNVTTGEELWVYYGGYNGGDSYYDNVPTSINLIQDGKIYTVSKEHIVIEPLRRDASLTCIDAFNGTVYWQLPWASRNALAVARGYLVGQNQMDNQMYVFGKGH